MKKNKKIHWFRITLIVLFICGIAGVILAAVQFKSGSRTYASASLQFSFDKAGEGKGPNGYPFDTKRITSDEVIAEALETTALADKYTVSQIQENLKVTAVYPEKIVKQMTRYNSILDANEEQQATLSTYYATNYNVVLFNDFDTGISSDQLTELLNNLLVAYRNDFAKTSGTGLSKTDPITDLDEYDYTQQLTVIKEASTQQSDYAVQMAELAPDFQQNRRNFDDIVVRYQNLNIDIDRLNAIITLNALSKDRERLQKQYEMEIKTLNWKLESEQEELGYIEELAGSYEKDSIVYVSTSGSLQKVSSNASETYDKLEARRKEITDSITKTKADIVRYETLLADITGKRNEESDVQAADSEISETGGETEEQINTSVVLSEEELAQIEENIEQKLQTLIAKKNKITTDFITMLNGYTDHEINEQTVSLTELQYEAPTFFSGAFIKQMIKTAGPLCMIGFIVCMVLLVISRRKEEKTNSVEMAKQNL